MTSRRDFGSGSSVRVDIFPKVLLAPWPHFSTGELQAHRKFAARYSGLIPAGVAKYVGNELKMEASARSQPKKDTIPATARRGESPPHGTVVAIVVL